MVGVLVPAGLLLVGIGGAGALLALARHYDRDDLRDLASSSPGPTFAEVVQDHLALLEQKRPAARAGAHPARRVDSPRAATRPTAQRTTRRTSDAASRIGERREPALPGSFRR